MPFFILICLCLCLSPAVAAAQADPPPALSEEEAVRLAIRNHPRLSAAVRDMAAARRGVDSARALANPELTFTPAFTPGGSDEEVLFRQPLELNGARGARAGGARAVLRQAEAQAIVTLRALVFDTKSAYYELARARAQQALAKELLASSEEIERITRRQVEVGTRPGIDQTQAGIEVIRARQQVTLAESQVNAAEAALNTLMGRPVAGPIGALSSLSGAASSVDERVALAQALENRAEIAAEEAAVEAFRHEAALARAEGRPDLVPQFRAGSVTRGVGEAGIGVGITLPLLDHGSRRGRIQQAEEAARAGEDRVAAIRAQVSQEVRQALVRVRAADAVVRDYEGGVLDSARRLLDASRTGFQAGQTGIVALLEAQRTFRSVQSEYGNALVAQAQARAELERATGAVSATLLPTASVQERKTRP